MTPRATQSIREYLGMHLGVPVVSRVPANRPIEFVRLVDLGGPPVADQVIDWASFSYEAWAATNVRAHDLAHEVRKLLSEMYGHYADGFVASGEADRPRDFFDEISGTPRYVG